MVRIAHITFVCWPPAFIPKIASHGNSKDKKPFYPTWPSTIDEIKKKCFTHGPKEMVEHLSSAVGAVLSASAPGELPRNEKQVTNLRQQSKGIHVGQVEKLMICLL